MATTKRPLSQHLPASLYAVIALITFLLSLGLLLIYVFYVPRLVQNGIEQRVFYILLLPWGIFAAVCLFGVMRSYARFTHRSVGHAMELGGPVVVFFLVVL